MSFLKAFRKLPADAYPIIGVTGLGFCLSLYMSYRSWANTLETTVNKRRPWQFLTKGKNEDWLALPKDFKETSGPFRPTEEKAKGSFNKYV
jgi:hypothetical protein